MSENVDHLILEHLKAIRAEVAAVKNDTSEIKSRLRDVENGFIDTKRGELHLHEVDARQQVSLDRILERLERLERRLELS